MNTLSDRLAFVRTHTRPQRPPHAPELLLHLADEVTPIWRMTEDELAERGLPPPFWAFAWAGGQAVARWVLDHPDEVAGKRVFDVATGSGLVAIAAAKAGAAEVVANDVDPFCEAAVALNAATNGVRLVFDGADRLAGPPPDCDVLLAGDVCYERPMAAQMLDWLRQAHDRGTRVLLGDPGRSYFPRDGLVRLAEHRVATTRELEDQEVKRTFVCTFPA